MKRFSVIIAIVLFVLVTCVFAACGNEAEKGDSSNSLITSRGESDREKDGQNGESVGQDEESGEWSLVVPLKP